MAASARVVEAMCLRERLETLVLSLSSGAQGAQDVLKVFPDSKKEWEGRGEGEILTYRTGALCTQKQIRRKCFRQDTVPSSARDQLHRKSRLLEPLMRSCVHEACCWYSQTSCAIVGASASAPHPKEGDKRLNKQGDMEQDPLRPGEAGMALGPGRHTAGLEEAAGAAHGCRQRQGRDEGRGNAQQGPHEP